jgi:hypothetical protein
VTPLQLLVQVLYQPSQHKSLTVPLPLLELLNKQPPAPVQLHMPHFFVPL